MALSTVTYNGVPLGMAPANPQHEIPDSAAWFLQDALIDEAGLIRRRGPTSAVSGTTTFTEGCSLIQTIRPDGVLRMVSPLVASTGQTFDSTGSKIGNLSFGLSLSKSPYTLFYGAPCLNSGTWIGSAYNVSTGQSAELLLWKGASITNPYNTGTVTVTRGSTSVTGVGTTWVDAHVGGFLLDSSNRCLGVVSAVNSTTSITLENPALYAIAAGSYKIAGTRGYVRRIAQGTISVTSGATAVTGAGTKFLDQGMQSGTWDLYRASDYTFIAQVVGSTTNIPSNFAAVLNSASSVTMTNEHYFAILNSDEAIKTLVYPQSGSRTVLSTPGFITTTHINRQWFANVPAGAGQYGDYGQRVWFSEEWQPETVDFSPVDGNFVQLPSTRGISTNITAIASTAAGLLVCSESETFLITGNDPTNFTVTKILADGCPSGMSMAAFSGGAMWAGKSGIYLHNGASVENVSVANLGSWYQQTLSGFDATTNRMYGFKWRDYYFLFVDGGASSPITVTKGKTSTSISYLCLAYYIPRGTWTTFTNFSFRGVGFPAGNNKCWAVINDGTHGNLIDVANYLDTEGVDTITGTGASAGPDLYIETKKYSVGDPLRLKVWRQCIFWFYLATSTLSFDIVPGMSTVGINENTGWTVSTPTWDSTGAKYATWDALAAAFSTWDALGGVDWATYKAHFQTTSQFLSFRMYQTDATVTKCRIGPWQIGFKLRRAGAS